MKIQSLTFVVTEDCNFDCTYCYKKKSKDYMKFASVKNTLIFFYRF